MDAGGRATQDAKAEGWGEERVGRYAACLASVSQAATNSPLSLRERVGVRGRQTALGRIALTPGPSPGGRGVKIIGVCYEPHP